MNKKVLIFCPKFFGYENRVANAFRSNGYEVDLYNERPSDGFIAKVAIRKNWRFYKPVIKKYLNQVIEQNKDKKYDYIIVFRGETIGERELLQLKTAFPNAKTIFYLWDSVENTIESKKKINIYDKVFTFDPNDAEKYKFEIQELKAKYSHVAEDFKVAEELARILMNRRNQRGAIDFDFPEAKIILTPEGKVADIKEYERRISNRIIEEFMLVTNETVAEHYFWLNIPFVYRIHETPASEKMQELSKFVSTFGYSIKGDLEEVHPKALQSIVNAIKGKREEEAISTIMLRSLRQARYSPECSGHFGLAAQYYSHFTSPIRRYPDLQIHRIMKEHLNNKINKKRSEQLVNTVDYASTQSSERERAADLAERDVKDYYKAVYMEDKIGEEFDGVVSSVTSFGMFIELPNTVEGLSRLANMGDDYYIYDEMTYTIIGERTRKTYRIGDPVRIRVQNVNVDLREIDFKILYKIDDLKEFEGSEETQPFDEIEE